MAIFSKAVKTPSSAWPATPLSTFKLSRELLGIALITLAALVFLSLWSYSGGENGENWVGLVGGYVAKGGVWLAGSASLLIPLIILLHGVRVFHEEPWLKTFRTFGGSVLSVLCLAALIHVNHPSTIEALHDGITAGVYGGTSGEIIARGITPLFAQLGGTVVLSFLLFTAVLLIMPFSIAAGLGRLHTTVRETVGKVGQLVRRPVSWSWSWRRPVWLGGGRTSAADTSITIHRSAVAQQQDTDSFFDKIVRRRKDRAALVDEPASSAVTASAAATSASATSAATTSSATTSSVIDAPTDADEFPEPSTSKRGAARKVAAGYHLPDPMTLLASPPVTDARQTDHILESQSQVLKNTLHNFGITGDVTEVHPGPVITMYEFVPGPGIKVARIVTLAHDLAMALKATSVRIVAPLPRKASVGIEVPNPVRDTVALREILTSEAYTQSRSKLTLALGKDIVGRPCVADLRTMPHLLVAGATGAGKSVGLNSMLLSLLFSAHPDEVKLLLIDPKVLELQVYDGIPHLLHPVLTNPKAAARGLSWVVQEMERRYRLLAEHGVRNIQAYNQKVVGDDAGGAKASTRSRSSSKAATAAADDADGRAEEPATPEPLPYIVVVVDEFADLMMMAPKDVEEKITRLAQMARASGIHLILATQRPSVDVVTGLIKANFPSRIAYQVSSKTDSRTILDANGAESLLGLGDMLYLAPGTGRLARLHGSYVSDDDVRQVVDYVKAQAGPDFCDASAFEEFADTEDDEQDDVYKQAREVVLSSGQASASLVQRRLRVGYPRAARMIEQMAEEGLVSAPGRDGRREVLGRHVAIEEGVG